MAVDPLREFCLCNLDEMFQQGGFDELVSVWGKRVGEAVFAEIFRHGFAMEVFCVPVSENDIGSGILGDLGGMLPISFLSMPWDTADEDEDLSRRAEGGDALREVVAVVMDDVGDGKSGHGLFPKRDGSNCNDKGANNTKVAPF
jgi:hypothetical protein